VLTLATAHRDGEQHPGDNGDHDQDEYGAHW
jgi:hypothetical protein